MNMMKRTINTSIVCAIAVTMLTTFNTTAGTLYHTPNTINVLSITMIDEDQTKTDEFSDPYTLDICPITKLKLGSMGDPVIKEYDGREVRFCCAGCVPKFKKDLKASWKEVDKEMIKDQIPFYPLQTCLISDDDLEDGQNATAVDFIYNNRLIRVANNSAKEQFYKHPKKYIRKLDEAVKDAQRGDYPLSTCLITKMELGSMGEPHEIVIANRLIRLCCAGCVSSINKDPLTHITTINEAWDAARNDG